MSQEVPVAQGIDGPQSPASDNDCSQDYGTQPMTQPLDLLDGSNVDQSMELSQDEWEDPQVVIFVTRKLHQKSVIYHHLCQPSDMGCTVSSP